MTTATLTLDLTQAFSGIKNQWLSDTKVLSQDIEASKSYSDGAMFNSSDRGRVAIFIDGSHLFYTASQLSLDIDYAKLLDRLAEGAPVLRTFFYTADEKQRCFLARMRQQGYHLGTQNLFQLPNRVKSSHLHQQIDADIKILAGYYDTAVLVSGDEELAYTVKAVRRQGVRVEVVSWRDLTSDKLREAADSYVDIGTIKKDIQTNVNFDLIEQLMAA
jgi:uncharacterized LabA/DUF88 family protein